MHWREVPLPMKYVSASYWRMGLLALLALAASRLQGQMPTPPATAPVAGIRSKPLQRMAYTNATLIPAPGQRVEKATILVENGLITAAGANVSIPNGTPVTDLAGKWVYPGFVEAWSHLGLPEVKSTPADDKSATKPGAFYWNPAIQSERNIADELKTLADASKLRGMGFTTAHVIPNDGIVRGTSAIVALVDGNAQEQLLRRDVALGISFSKGSSKASYPSSLTGSIALLRQSLLDAQWYRAAQAKLALNPAAGKLETNYSLAALGEHLANKKPLYFQAANNNDVERILALAKEFGFTPVIAGSGYEYERQDLLAGKPALILPLSFPNAIDVEDPADALNTSLQQMRRWEQAPANPVWLHQKGQAFSLTAQGLKTADEFWANLRKTVALGLPQDKALEALTLQPARQLGIDRIAGSIAPNKRADFIVASGNIFEQGTSIHYTYVSGIKHEVNAVPEVDARGTWLVQYDGRTDSLIVAGEAAKPTVKLKRGKTELTGSLTDAFGAWTLSFPADTAKTAATYRLRTNAHASEWSGSGVSATGQSIVWTARRIAPHTPTPPKSAASAPKLADIGSYSFPNNGYGFAPGKLPAAGTVLLQGATVWTSTNQGVLQNADVLIQNGKIVQVGIGIKVPAGATVVDAKGKYVTAGIIDEHSHIAGERGINEGAQANSSEVRMLDVVNPEDIQIYRQLAGGVTAVQLLHGSANPIGGQSALLKLRWGMGADQVKLDGQPKYIKFALGENVKSIHWNDAALRYPKSRMGVEQFIKDQFQAAKEYQAQWDAYRAAGADKSTLPPPRRDLELETIAEIIRGERNISCHSYIQSEITMLIRLAEEMGFKVNTFTHILEGYKVADKMAAHGSSAAGFADWWAYKQEVYEAIPGSPALMMAQGVNTVINSDDAEMARRLNQEAAKSVKYAGMDEVSAWNMVTINSAKALKVDGRMGSLAPGKDGDVVVWSDNPLSIYARAEQTYVDGRLLYDARRDADIRNQIAAERTRLINKLLAAKKNGDKAYRPALSFSWGDAHNHAHLCEDMTDYGAIETRD